MTEKKIQENPLPESMGTGATAAQVQLPVGGVVVAAREPPGVGAGGKVEAAAGPMPDLYRKLLPAALFLLTFVTVMTVLLVYMDTTAVGAQQFRLNMTRDYELSRIAADDPALISYIKQMHMSLPAGEAGGAGGGGAGLGPAAEAELPSPDARVLAVHRLSGYKYGGRYLVVAEGAGGAGGAGDAQSQLEVGAAARWLGAAAGWRGVLALAEPRAYLAQRARTRPGAGALHAALAPAHHPREVSYLEEGGFSSRVLCFPLTTLLLLTADVAAPPQQQQQQQQQEQQQQQQDTLVDYVVLESPQAHQALASTPYLPVQVLELWAADDVQRARSTALLRRRGFHLHLETETFALYARANRTISPDSPTSPSSTTAATSTSSSAGTPSSAPALR